IDGNIVVEGAQSDINVYNLAGAVVATASAQEGSTIIDASSLGSGIYLVRIGDKAYKIRK
ncbi:MAG: T9SS type A sorting domain-containing protein, partial [Muribaculaceae bacterium]|nr:T9SS type A sorting domain-containing protein [Muribaculaceae bacterium]